MLIAVLQTCVAFGQTAATINGVVTDPSGLAIPGATVTATNTQTSLVRPTVTNNAGNYDIPNLPPGTYSVRVEGNGFEPIVRNGVELQVQQTAKLDFQLKVQAVANTVEVTAGAPLVDTETATVGMVINNKSIIDLPLNGRSFIDLIALDSNVESGQTANSGWSTIRGNADRGSVSISVAGMRREFTQYSLDGVPNSEVDFNTYALLPSIDALQEFKVESGVYSAEYGREAAQVNIGTKSGTNSYHGTLFEFLRNNDVDALPYAFTTATPPSNPYKWNQFGFTLGGPIQIPKVFNGKDRLFFMSNYEGFRLRQRSEQVYSVPSDAMRSGNFSQILPSTVITNPFNNNAPFPGNIIPASLVNPTAQSILSFQAGSLYPAPNVPGAGLSNNYEALLPGVTNKDQFTQRIDYLQNERSTWFGRFSFQNEGINTSGTVLSAAVLGYASEGINTVNVKQGVISNSFIIKPNIVNEAHFSFAGFDNSVLSNYANTTNVTADLGINFGTGALPSYAWGVPDFNISGFSGFTSNYDAPYIVHEQTFDWSDNVSWTHGKHTTAFGFEIRRDRFDDEGGQVSDGFFTLNGHYSGYGFSDFMLGLPYITSNTASIGVGQFRATSQAYYINDNWKVRPNLSIMLGLRYEYTPPWGAQNDSVDNIVVPYLNLAPPVPEDEHPYLARDCAAYGQTSFYPPGDMVQFNPAIQTKCVSNLGSTIVGNNLTNFAPRLGVAWNPGKWVIRTGAGIFYVQDQGDTFFDEALNSAGKSLYDTPNYPIGTLTFANPYPLGPNPCGTSLPNVCVSDPVLLGNATSRKTPLVGTYELNIQRQLGDNMVLEIGYLGTIGRRLERPLGYNDAYPSATGTVASRQPYPEFNLLQLTESVAESNYNSATAKLTRRLARGLSGTVAYTFSKSLDDGSGIRGENTAVTTSPQVPWCVTCDYSLSDFDSRNRFIASVLYELPFGKGKPFLNSGWASTVIGGWQLNSIITLSSGFPLELVDGINQANDAFGYIRPNAVPGVNGNDGPKTTEQWFNVDSVYLQPFGTFGNVGRNTIIGPGVNSWDFSAFKNFTFTERTYLQFRFECFNCANHPNWADPNTTLKSDLLNSEGLAIPGSGSFGTITATRPGIDMREIQFGLKLYF